MAVSEAVIRYRVISVRRSDVAEMTLQQTTVSRESRMEGHEE